MFINKTEIILGKVLDKTPEKIKVKCYMGFSNEITHEFNNKHLKEEINDDYVLISRKIRNNKSLVEICNAGEFKDYITNHYAKIWS